MMRQALLSAPSPVGISGTIKSSASPIGGWNARDPLAAMPVKDAIWLENFFPSTAEVVLRKGALNWATGIPSNTLSLMAYSGPITQKLFAATIAGVYDCTAGGAVGAAVIAVTSGQFCHTMFTVAGGSYLMAVNGHDRLLRYDGTTWTFVDAATGVAPITGLATTLLSNVHAFKRKLWFVQQNSLSMWYLPTATIGGALIEFPLGQLFKDGGSLVAMTSWTIDAGEGADDYAAFITSEGQIAIYKGTDPATDFALVGVYFVGSPMGRKCFIKFGGDVLILTQMGLFPLSKALLSVAIDRASAVSLKIDSVFSAAATSYANNFGWTGEVFAVENLLLVNVPTVSGVSSNQLVMNTITNAWCLFTGWNAFCWETWKNELYFGGANFVAKAYTDLANYSDFGNNIVAYAKGAFNYFNTPLNKQFSLIRPMLSMSGDVSVSLGLDTDFSDIDTSSSVTIPFTNAAKWDTAQWDVDLWTPDYAVRKDWRTVFANPGLCAAVRLRIASKNVKVGWSSTDFFFKKGGVL